MELPSPEDFFSYFKECYKLNYKEFSVNNLLHSKYKFKWFASENEELINSHSPIIYYDNQNISSLEKELQLYQLEMTLYYGAFYHWTRGSDRIK